jgi:hypothetical protein
LLDCKIIDGLSFFPSGQRLLVYSQKTTTTAVNTTFENLTVVAMATGEMLFQGNGVVIQNFTNCSFRNITRLLYYFS